MVEILAIFLFRLNSNFNSMGFEFVFRTVLDVFNLFGSLTRFGRFVAPIAPSVVAELGCFVRYCRINVNIRGYVIYLQMDLFV